MPDGRKTYYAMLGVRRDASPEEIRRAYFALAQQLHPDKNKLAGETELFLGIQQAYEVLASPQRRAQYDSTLPPEEDSEPPVAWRAQYSRPSLVHLTEPQLIYILLDAEPRSTGDKPAAPPLNLCLLLDRSTSMGGEKLDLAKAAALQIVQSLRPEDIFSIVSFADRPEVLLPASYQSDRSRLAGRIQGIHAGGGTEIYQGLAAGIEELRRGVGDERVSHLILLTDGHTYGDEQNCLALAEGASQQNIGISAFGIGTEWNDIFLDALAAKSGNTSTYISKPDQTQRLLIQKFQALTSTFAEDTLFSFTPCKGVIMSYAFRLQPESAPISLEKELHLGPILQETRLSVLLEMLIEPSALEGDSVTLLDGTLRLVMPARRSPQMPIPIQLERPVADAPRDDPPPTAILDALSRFTLYRLQERARQEADAQEYDAATRHLKNLAALLLAQGEKDLAKTALLEAEQTEKMRALSKEGGKEIKYGTRALFGAPVEKTR
jgi:Ca-activated chloride channel family protein